MIQHPIEYQFNLLEEGEVIIKKILKKFPGCRVFALSGDLGSGKTTFVKAFCRVLGIEDNVSSPTFTIVQEYGDNPKVYHFDLYRLKEITDLYQIGFEEYFDQKKSYIFIEWPELAEKLLPEKYIEIQFEVVGENQRHLTCRLIENI